DGNEPSDGQVGGHDDPSTPPNARRKLTISIPKLVKPRRTGRMRATLVLQNPDCQDRGKSGGQEIGGNHREADRQRQRDEKIVCRTLHEEGGDKDSENTKHCKKPRNKRLGRAVVRSVRE